MKKMLFTALVAACAMTACGTKTTETAAEEEVAREVGSSDIAYVQVEAVLAQCDLFLNEAQPCRKRPRKLRRAGLRKSKTCRPKPPSCRKNTRKG